ncbi:MAG: ribosome recycling factor [bacterium]
MSLSTDDKAKFEAAFNHYKQELMGLRTGRASAALVENISVQAYGGAMPIKSLGSISVPDARTVVVDPWDKSLIKEIEKAITDARIGTNPVVDGAIIRLSFPQMTEEARKQVVKILGQKQEEAKIEIRQIREALREALAKKEQDHLIGEDERFRSGDELDKFTKEQTERLEKLTQEKEQEIMTI